MHEVQSRFTGVELRPRVVGIPSMNGPWGRPAWCCAAGSDHAFSFAVPSTKYVVLTTGNLYTTAVLLHEAAARRAGARLLVCGVVLWIVLSMVMQVWMRNTEHISYFVSYFAGCNPLLSCETPAVNLCVGAGLAPTKPVVCSIDAAEPVPGSLRVHDPSPRYELALRRCCLLALLGSYE